MIDFRDDRVFYVQLLIALANLGLFSLVFILMGYFELIGSDPAYYDQGTINNIKMINSVTGIFGLEINPEEPRRISTLMWSTLLGVALISSYFAIVIGNRRPIEEYEVTDLRK
jgi:hypothetical protein